ncbi:hypothetical protein SD70_24610 [Gordoniibacillus kamchatkensis]|uniref:Uncharacterized protein n=1 Tax=Gordoniibacillus kamchatkensis TaxID=1590651 RepID=A0ABR5ACD7_9BACL|nr:hypothetical protein [Paenibacillus sp. VKM B-2647]KIL38714.1 hypothetical protein SD70_24610 [Paenibacillus sp. VKM B-2647]
MGKMTQHRRQPRQTAHLPAAVTPEDCRRLLGVPICAVLKDGSVYCGTIAGIENEEIVMHGVRSGMRVSRNANQAKAQIAALGGLGSLFGGAAPGAAAAAGASGAGGGLLGGMGNALGGLFGGGGGGFGGIGNWLRIGMGVVQFIFPLLKGFGF